MPKSRRILVPLIVIAALVIGGVAFYFGLGSKAQASGPIEASGTVEAVEVSIAAEMSGRVVEVMATKGQPVEAGDVLLRLDDALLQAQREQAEWNLQAARSNLETARTGLDLAQAGLKSAEAGLSSAEASQKAELIVAQQSLDSLYENAAVAKTRANQAVAAANRAVREATYQLDNFTVPTTQSKMTTTEALAIMKQRLDLARKAFEPYRNESSGNTTRKDLKEKLDEAQADYDAAVKRMEYETAAAQAQAQLEKATQDLEKVWDGPDPDQIAAQKARMAAIEASVEPARAAVTQAQSAVGQAQAKLDQAQDGVAQSQSQLDLVLVQLEKLAIHAPASGILLSRDVEPGEVVQVGGPMMTLGELNRLKIRVYTPEDRYGQVKLGDPAAISVDSFPGRKFSGQVSYIAGQAEFTPSNVQTTEGRRTTVFAIEVTVENPQGELKPGMPADVCFGCR